MLWQAFGRWGGIGGIPTLGAEPPVTQGDGGLADNATSNNPVNVPYPAGLFTNDIAFLQAAILDSLGANSVNTPAGWTKVGNYSLNGEVTHDHALFWKRLDGSESGTVTITAATAHEATDCLMGVMSIHRGAIAAGTPYEALGDNTGQSTSMAGDSVTTLGANRLILNFCVSDDDTLSAPAGGWTEKYDHLSISGSSDGALKLYSKVRAAAGAEAGATHTLATSERWQVISLALIPA
jgi:hypothetical protein